MEKIRAIIAFDGYTRTVGVRGSRRLCDMYVYSVSWGKGSEITKTFFGPDKAKAAEFSSSTAVELGKQLVKRFRNVNVRVIVGNRIENISALVPKPVPSAEAIALTNDLRKFVTDIKALGPLGVLVRDLGLQG